MPHSIPFGVTTDEQHTISENLPIVLGCSHACACVIPGRRGKDAARPGILNEAKVMVDGAKELVLPVKLSIVMA